MSGQSKDRTAGGKYTLLSIRVPTHVAENFRVVAEANHRSVSGELRFLMERHVDEAAIAEAA